MLATSFFIMSELSLGLVISAQSLKAATPATRCHWKPTPKIDKNYQIMNSDKQAQMAEASRYEDKTYQISYYYNNVISYMREIIRSISL